MSFVNNLVTSFSAIKQSQTQSQVSYAVAGKQLDATRQQGDAAVQLIEAAANVGKSQHTGKVLDKLA